jgi:mRNA-degrading endonuclease toxin of MazEF toxin-antitoxin module
MERSMNRGDVWQVDLRGRAGKRPALILTRQAVIPFLNKLTVAEVTTQGKGYPTEVAIGQPANLTRDSYVQLDNIQTISKERFVRHLGHLDEKVMRLIGRKAVIALGLEDSL